VAPLAVTMTWPVQAPVHVQVLSLKISWAVQGRAVCSAVQCRAGQFESFSCSAVLGARPWPSYFSVLRAMGYIVGIVLYEEQQYNEVLLEVLYSKKYSTSMGPMKYR